MSQCIRFAVAVPDGEPPTEFCVFNAGTTDTSYGTYLFDEVASALVMQAYAQQGNPLMIDYEHKSLDPTAPPGAGKAAGWFRPEVRGGALWAANVEWTEPAADALRKREWRFFSPAAFLDSATGRVEELINIGLTNMPATREMVPLVASRKSPEKPAMSFATFATILGLTGTASEKEIEEAARRLVESGKASEALVASLLAATGSESTDAALGVLAGWKEGAAQATKLSERVASLESDRETRERDALIAAHPRKFSPAMKTWAKTQSLVALQGFVTSAPNIPALEASALNDSEPLPIAAGKTWSQLTSMEKHDLYCHDRVRYELLKAQAR